MFLLLICYYSPSTFELQAWKWKYCTRDAFLAPLLASANPRRSFLKALNGVYSCGSVHGNRISTHTHMVVFDLPKLMESDQNKNKIKQMSICILSVRSNKTCKKWSSNTLPPPPPCVEFPQEISSKLKSKRYCDAMEYLFLKLAYKLSHCSVHNSRAGPRSMPSHG